MLVAHDAGFFRGSRSILEGVGVSLRPGRVTALLGPNGAGKSTLLRLLVGELAAQSGRIELEGTALADLPPADLARRRAVLPQETQLSFAFPVREVVMMGRLPHLRGGERPRDWEICAAALACVEAGHLAARLYTTLSAGEKQRIQLARVLAQIWEKPSTGHRYLLMDEPTAGLDLEHQHGILTLVSQWAREDAAVLVILHDLNLALAYADDAWVLDQGKLAANGPVEEVLNPEQIRQVFHLNAELISRPGSGRPVLITSPLH